MEQSDVYVPKGHHEVSTDCQKEPDLWFSDRSVDKDRAKAICESCPEKLACLAQAEVNKEVYGIWGGVDFNPGGKRLTTEDKAPRLCRKNLHLLSGPGRCITCKNLARRIRSKNLPKIKRIRKDKNTIGGTCRRNEHVLTKENTQIRSFDGALMCLQCLRSLARTRFKTDTGNRTGKANSGVWNS